MVEIYRARKVAVHTVKGAEKNATAGFDKVSLDAWIAKIREEYGFVPVNFR